MKKVVNQQREYAKQVRAAAAEVDKQKDSVEAAQDRLRVAKENKKKIVGRKR
jgi:hypothetical protein